MKRFHSFMSRNHYFPKVWIFHNCCSSKEAVWAIYCVRTLFASMLFCLFPAGSHQRQRNVWMKTCPMKCNTTDWTWCLFAIPECKQLVSRPFNLVDSQKECTAEQWYMIDESGQRIRLDLLTFVALYFHASICSGYACWIKKIKICI